MAIDLLNYEQLSKDAVSFFWDTRSESAKKQAERGIRDQGERSAVTAGKNMNGFIELAKRVVLANGLEESDFFSQSRLLTLPGFFRPTKRWDLLVVHNHKLIAALEFKSQVGPSFGNNFNNRCEEAIGAATDLWTAYRENSFEATQRPFLGYLMLLEDCDGSRRSVKTSSPHFPVRTEFENSSYAERYHLLCDKLMQERLYDSATLLLSRSPANGGKNGEYSELNEDTGLKHLAAGLASKVSATVAMEKSH